MQPQVLKGLIIPFQHIICSIQILLFLVPCKTGIDPDRIIAEAKNSRIMAPALLGPVDIAKHPGVIIYDLLPPGLQ